MFCCLKCYKHNLKTLLRSFITTSDQWCCGLNTSDHDDDDDDEDDDDADGFRARSLGAGAASSSSRRRRPW